MTNRTRQFALVFVGLAWSAFVVVPALHLIHHHDDHIHIGGAVIPIRAARHDHNVIGHQPDRAEASAAHAALRPGPQREPSRAPEPSPHKDEGGVSHFNALVLVPDTAAPIGTRVIHALDLISVAASPPRPVNTRSAHRGRAPPRLHRLVHCGDARKHETPFAQSASLASNMRNGRTDDIVVVRNCDELSSPASIIRAGSLRLRLGLRRRPVEATRPRPRRVPSTTGCAGPTRGATEDGALAGWEDPHCTPGLPIGALASLSVFI